MTKIYSSKDHEELEAIKDCFQGVYKCTNCFKIQGDTLYYEGPIDLAEVKTNVTFFMLGYGRHQTRTMFMEYGATYNDRSH